MQHRRDPDPLLGRQRPPPSSPVVLSSVLDTRAGVWEDTDITVRVEFVSHLPVMRRNAVCTGWLGERLAGWPRKVAKQKVGRCNCSNNAPRYAGTSSAQRAGKLSTSSRNSHMQARTLTHTDVESPLLCRESLFPLFTIGLLLGLLFMM